METVQKEEIRHSSNSDSTEPSEAEAVASAYILRSALHQEAVVARFGGSSVCFLAPEDLQDPSTPTARLSDVGHRRRGSCRLSNR